MLDRQRRVGRRRIAPALAWALMVLVLARAAGHADADADGDTGRDGLALARALAATEPAALARAIEAIEAAAPDVPYVADALFAAARACEDALADPARALALYERILRDHPGAGVAGAAERRAEALRAAVGAAGRHAREAAELAQLVAGADRLADAEVVRRAEALAAAAWPGAPEAARWLAEWHRRSGRLDEAAAAYARVVVRWPDAPEAAAARSGAAGVALEQRDWDRAEALTRRLPALDPADRVLRDELLDAIATGRRRARWYTAAWLVVAGVIAALGASLAEASLRGGRARPSLRPPAEVLYLAPVAAVLVAVALTTHELVAPAVTILSAGGLVLAWLSGAGLDTLRARGRRVRLRAVAHAALCLAALAALVFIVLMRDGLLDLVIETVRFGPEG